MHKKIFLLLPLCMLLNSFRESLGKTISGSTTFLREGHFRKGFTWMERKNYAIAQKYFDAHIASIKPETIIHDHRIINAYYYATLCATKLGSVDSVEKFQQFIAQFPAHTLANQANYELGNLYCRQQDYDLGINYYLKVQETALDLNIQAAYRFRLAYAYLNNRSFAEAGVWFRKCKELSVDYSAASNYYAGYLELKNKDYTNALKDLQTAQKHRDYEVVVPYLILEVFYQSGDYQGVIDYAKEVDNKHLDCIHKADIALLTAESYFLRKDYQTSIALYESYFAIEDQEALPDVKFRIGYALYTIKEYHKAIKYFKDLALQEDKLAQLACYYLGLSYMYTKQKNLAIQAFQQASKLTFDDRISEEAAFQYAKLNYDLGYESIALEALQSIKQTYPNSEHMATVDKLLSQMYLQMQNYDLAIAHIDSLPQKKPAMRKAYQKATLYKATTYYNQADYSTAIIWLQKSISHPIDKELTAQAHFFLAESYLAKQAYEQAIVHYQSVLTALQPSNTYHQDACYGLAYTYFNTGTYTKALPLFLQYEKAIKNETAFKIDALTRAADCYYADKSYQNAIDLYEILKTKNPIHSRYQKALIYAIIGKLTEAKKNLEFILNADKNNLYYEKALYDYAYLVFQYQEYATAITYFTRLMEEKPHSTAIPNALLYRAIAYVNLNQYAAAENDYLTLLTKYPTHPATENALLELPKLTNAMGPLEKIQEYIESYKSQYATNDKLSILALETAKNLMYSQNYPQAIEQLEAFIIQYPDSVNIEEAYFFLAEAYYRLEDMLQAREAYQKIVNQQSLFYNKVLLRIATIAYKGHDFPLALTNYSTLHTRATSKKEQYHALEGMMKSNHALQHYDEVKKIGKMIIQLGAITVNGAREAALYSAKASMQQGAYEEALEQLKQITQAQDIYAAEGQLITAQIYHQLSDYKTSLDILFAFTKQHAHQKNLLEQGFLLIADNYIALEETFQAKATLQSIIEHTTDQTISDKAKEKLNDLLQETPFQESTDLDQSEKSLSQDDTQAFDNLFIGPLS